MGFFDKVKDALTTSDAERAENARETAEKAQGRADEIKAEAQERADEVQQQAQEEAAEKQADAAGAEGDSAEKHTEKTEYRTYTVRSGDTLAGIAAQHGVDRRELARLNKLDNPDLIYPGQVFKVPSS